VIKLLKDTTHANYLALILVSLLLHVSGFILPTVEEFDHFTLLDNFFYEIYVQNKIFSLFLAYLFNLFFALGINYMVNRFGIFDSKSLMYSYTYLLVCACSPTFLYLNTLHLVFLLLFVTVYILLHFAKLNEKDTPISLLILGFILSVLSLIGLAHSVYIVLVIVGLFFFKPINIKDYLTVLFGILLFAFFSISIAFITDSLDTFLSHWKLGEYILNLDIIQVFETPFYLLIVLASMGLFKSLSTFWKSTFFIRKVQQFILIFLGIGLVVAFTNNYSYNFDLFYFAMPIAMYMGMLFEGIKRQWIAEVVNALIIICIIWYQYEYLLEYKFSELPLLLNGF
jgi:hypothetical protein